MVIYFVLFVLFISLRHVIKDGMSPFKLDHFLVIMKKAMMMTVIPKITMKNLILQMIMHDAYRNMVGVKNMMEQGTRQDVT